MNKMLSNKKTIAIFILPAILIFTLIIPVPLIMSVGLSFFDWDLLSKAKFVGIRNFVKLFTRDDIFRMSIGNTFQYLGLSILFQIPLAYFLAILLTRGKRFEKLVRNYFRNGSLPYVLFYISSGGRIVKCFFKNDRSGRFSSFLACGQ